MDWNQMIQELRTERDQVDEAILILELLARKQGKRRGRPPAWLKEIAEKRGRKVTARKRARKAVTD
jgi:hypothetical protein